MKIINFPNTNEYSNNKKLIVLGKFNIIHLGHKELLNKAKQIAIDKNLELIIMIFKQNKEGILNLKERIMFLKEYNPDYIMTFEPIKENFAYTKDMFIDWMKSINITNVVVGEGFKFGNNRQGTNKDLINNFNALIIDDVKLEDERISTSNLTNNIIEGDMINFKNRVNYYYFYKGIVVKGQQRGNGMGFPTANVEFPKDRIKPSNGIYLSYIIIDDMRLPSLTSISNNPTFNDSEELFFETYILNFDENIYGKEVYVELIEKIRDPIKFTTVENLIEEMNKDKLIANNYFFKQ